LLAFTILDRVFALPVGCGLRWVRDRAALRKAWLYPAARLHGFCFWSEVYFGSRRLRYRGDPYELLPQEGSAVCQIEGPKLSSTIKLSTTTKLSS